VSSLHRDRPYEALYKRFKDSVRRNGRRHNKLPIQVSFTYEDFLQFTAVSKCHYCGDDVFWSKFNTNVNGAAYNLDRKDNSKGYETENVVVCCKRCNFGKADRFTYEEWMEMTRWLKFSHENPTKLEKAIRLATYAHVGQIDVEDNHNPHIVHSLEVMLYVQQEYGAYSAKHQHYTLEELMVAAVLHDVVEDTSLTLDDIRQQFSDKVATLVDGVTRRHGDPGCKVPDCKEHTKETYRDFIYRSREDEGCKFIKIIDLLRNLARTHKIGIKKAKWRNKLEYKYGLAIRVLTSPEPTTWEKQSYQVLGGRCYMADPNGKEIEVTPEELRAATLS
jgi:hypothetical protein